MTGGVTDSLIRPASPPAPEPRRIGSITLPGEPTPTRCLASMARRMDRYLGRPKLSLPLMTIVANCGENGGS